MKDYLFSFDRVPMLSKRDVASQTWNDAINKFHKYEPKLDGFKAVIEDKSKQAINRRLLVNTLLKQSERYELSESSKKNIALLDEKTTFTITTAHQPCFLTGPLYFIYKIISTINLCEKLKNNYPTYDFVPIFVVGGEDHDFDEVNHVHLFGKTYEWESDSSGSVGRMEISSMKTTLDQVYNLFGNGIHVDDLKSLIETAYENNETYLQFTTDLIYGLFSKYGLVCLSMDDADLKKEMDPIFKQELVNQVSKPLVVTVQKEIANSGYKAQVHARDINLFYLFENQRRRFEYRNGMYQVIGSDIAFSEANLLIELENNPERFSPNVILRPLYQEKILPNLAYVGGGGELAYWIELRKVFKHFKVNFPMLVRRDSVLLIDKMSKKLMDKTQLSIGDVFMDKQILINNLLSSKVDFTLDIEKEAIHAIFEQIKNKAGTIDSSLESSVSSIQVKQIKLIDGISGRMKKAVKLKEENRVKQLEKLLNRLHPHNKLQERYDNFIPFYLQYGDQFITILKNKLDPMIKEFKVITLE